MTSDLLADARGRETLGADVWDQAECDGAQLTVEAAIALGLATAGGSRAIASTGVS